MPPGVRVSPLERRIERDGVSVVLSHAGMLAMEALLWGGSYNMRDFLVRVHGNAWARYRFDTARHHKLMSEIRKAARVLGLALIAIGPDYRIVEAA